VLVSARTATPADVKIGSGTVVTAASVASVEVNEAIADAATSTTDPAETCSRTVEAAAEVVVTAVVVIVAAVTVAIAETEESASAAPHPRAERSLLLI
jgi:hypothetical protein